MTILPYGYGIWTFTIVIGQVFAFLNKQRDLNPLPIALKCDRSTNELCLNPPSRA